MSPSLHTGNSAWGTLHGILRETAAYLDTELASFLNELFGA